MADIVEDFKQSVNLYSVIREQLIQNYDAIAQNYDLRRYQARELFFTHSILPLKLH